MGIAHVRPEACPLYEVLLIRAGIAPAEAAGVHAVCFGLGVVVHTWNLEDATMINILGSRAKRGMKSAISLLLMLIAAAMLL
jgi:hypothetical protein